MKNIAIIATDNCKWCTKIKKYLDDNEYVYSIFYADHNPTVTALYQAAGFKTVPQVFIDGKHIGGYERTVAYLEENPG